MVAANPLVDRFINFCKASALKSGGNRQAYLLDLVQELEGKITAGEVPAGEVIPLTNHKVEHREALHLACYSAMLALAGLVAVGLFMTIKTLSEDAANVLTWILLPLGIGFNLLTGTAIVQTMSRYIKSFTEKSIRRVKTLLTRLMRTFDVWVAIAFVWSIRSLVKKLTTIELLPLIDVVFQISIPDWMLDILARIGYNAVLSFLQNVDLFLGHLVFKMIGLGIIFWTMSVHGLQYFRKSAFEAGMKVRNRVYLVVGVIATIPLAIISYSSAAEMLGFATSTGVLVGCVLYYLELYRKELRFISLMIGTITCGIVTTWLLWSGGIIASSISALASAVSYLVVRQFASTRLDRKSVLASIQQKARSIERFMR
jgi:hypothetical protein